MALWLDLIPKIHRSDNLDERFHLLDNFDDVDSFDADGVDLSRLDQLQRSYATSTTTPPTNTTTTSPRTGNSIARTQPPPPKPSPLPSRPRPTSTARPTTSRTTSGSTVSRLLRSLFSRSRDGSVPLGVTVAVGCGLLFLNVLVFAAIFYQREKATRDVREWRRRRRTDTGSSAGDDDDDPADKYFDEAQDSFSETVRSSGAGGGAGDTDSNSSLSVALCPSKIGTTTGDDNDAHLYRTHLQQPALHHQQRSNDVHLTTLPQSSSTAGDNTQYDSVKRSCCRRSSPCHLDTFAAGERRAAPTILKDAGRRQQLHGGAVQSPPPPPPPTSKSPATVSVVISNHNHPLQCYDDNPSTTV